MADYRIDFLSPQDQDAWQSLWYEYLEFYQTTLDKSITQTLWQRIITKDVYGFGIYDGTSLIAFAHCVIHYNTWNVEPVCYLEDLFVTKTARCQGVARRLIEHIYQIAKAQKWHRVYWITDQNNHTAQSVYDKLADKPAVVLYRKSIELE